MKHVLSPAGEWALLGVVAAVLFGILATPPTKPLTIVVGLACIVIAYRILKNVSPDT